MALDLIAELEAVIDAFDRAGIEYALCGGLAVAIHGHPRATMDIDVLVPDEILDAAIEAAKQSGFDIPARNGLRSGTPRVTQRVSKLDPDTGELMTLDLLVVGPGYESVWDTRTVMEWRGRQLSIVSREGLATMKRIVGRPQDLADLAKLEGTDDDDEA